MTAYQDPGSRNYGDSDTSTIRSTRSWFNGHGLNHPADSGADSTASAANKGAGAGNGVTPGGTTNAPGVSPDYTADSSTAAPYKPPAAPQTGVHQNTTGVDVMSSPAGPSATPNTTAPPLPMPKATDFNQRVTSASAQTLQQAGQAALNAPRPDHITGFNAPTAAAGLGTDLVNLGGLRQLADTMAQQSGGNADMIYSNLMRSSGGQTYLDDVTAHVNAMNAGGANPYSFFPGLAPAPPPAPPTTPASYSPQQLADAKASLQAMASAPSPPLPAANGAQRQTPLTPGPPPAVPVGANPNVNSGPAPMRSASYTNTPTPAAHTNTTMQTTGLVGSTPAPGGQPLWGPGSLNPNFTGGANPPPPMPTPPPPTAATPPSQPAPATGALADPMAGVKDGIHAGDVQRAIDLLVQQGVPHDQAVADVTKFIDNMPTTGPVIPGTTIPAPTTSPAPPTTAPPPATQPQPTTAPATATAPPPTTPPAPPSYQPPPWSNFGLPPIDTSWLTSILQPTPGVTAEQLTPQEMARYAQLTAKLAVDPQMQFLKSQLDLLPQKMQAALQPILARFANQRAAAIARSQGQTQAEIDRMARTRLYDSPYGQYRIGSLGDQLNQRLAGIDTASQDAIGHQGDLQNLEAARLQNQMGKLTEQQGNRAELDMLKLTNSSADRVLKAQLADQHASQQDKALAFKVWAGTQQAQDARSKLLLDSNFKNQAQAFKQWMDTANLSAKEQGQVMKAYLSMNALTEKSREFDITTQLKDLISQRSTNLKAGDLMARLSQIFGYKTDTQGNPVVDENGNPQPTLGSQKLTWQEQNAQNMAMERMSAKHGPAYANLLFHAMTTGSPSDWTAAERAYTADGMQGADIKSVVGFWKQYPPQMAEAAERYLMGLRGGDAQGMVQAANDLGQYEQNPLFSKLAGQLQMNEDRITAADKRAANTLAEAKRHHQVTEANGANGGNKVPGWVHVLQSQEHADYSRAWQQYTHSPAYLGEAARANQAAANNGMITDASGRQVPYTANWPTFTPGQYGYDNTKYGELNRYTSGMGAHDRGLYALRGAKTGQEAWDKYHAVNPNPSQGEQDALTKYMTDMGW